MLDNCGGGYFLSRNFTLQQLDESYQHFEQKNDSEFSNADTNTAVQSWTDFVDIVWEGSGTESDPYRITSAEELAGLASQIETGESYIGQHFKQTRNINLGGRNWKSPGLWSSDGNHIRFRGTYDGNNCNIAGLVIEESENFVGLFGYTSNSCFKNINLIAPQISVTGAYTYVGGIVGAGDSITMENCHVKGGKISGYGHVAGVCGGGSVGVYKNCSNSASISASGGDAIGGCFGWVGGSCNITGSVNYGDVISSGNGTGGIVGSLEQNAEIKRCINYGSVTSGGSYTGGIAGYPVENANFEKCINDGNIEGMWRTGGIAGGSYIATFTECINNANIIGLNDIGGIIGWTTSGTISKCMVYGRIEETNLDTWVRIGGLVGSLSETTFGAVSLSNCAMYCSLISAIDNPATFGAIVGDVGAIITNCTFYGASNVVGVGFVSQDTALETTITGCYAEINQTKIYSSGDFSGFGIVESMNGGLPLQKELFHIANGSTASSADVIARLKSFGYVLKS